MVYGQAYAPFMAEQVLSIPPCPHLSNLSGERHKHHDKTHNYLHRQHTSSIPKVGWKELRSAKCRKVAGETRRSACPQRFAGYWSTTRIARELSGGFVFVVVALDGDGVVCTAHAARTEERVRHRCDQVPVARLLPAERLAFALIRLGHLV